MPPADRTAWERLGRLLAERRSQISPRYRNRRAFAAEREMNWRTLHDVELAKRDNFTPATMSAFESAYMLAPGSLERTLAGGDLEPARVPGPAPLRAVPAPRPGGSVAVGVLFAMLDRHPDDDDLAGEVLTALLRLFPDDKIVTDVLGTQLQEGKPARVIVGEIRQWLEFLESKGLGGAGLREDGASAGLPARNLKGNVKIAAR